MSLASLLPPVVPSSAPGWFPVYEQTLGNRQGKQHLRAGADVGALPSQAVPCLSVCCGDSRGCVPGPPCPGADPCLSRCSLLLLALRKGALGLITVMSLQIVLLSWTVCSCAFVGLAPCGLGLSWDQQGREAGVLRSADTGRLLELLLPGPSCSRAPPAPQLEEPRYSDGSEALLATVALDSGGCPRSPGPGGAGPAYLHQHLGCARPCRTPGG